MQIIGFYGIVKKGRKGVRTMPYGTINCHEYYFPNWRVFMDFFTEMDMNELETLQNNISLQENSYSMQEYGYADCGGSCSGSCSGDCSGSCSGDCSGSSDGECSISYAGY